MNKINYSKLKVVNMESIEAKLYNLIDDIDTFSDLFKPENNSYHKSIQRKIKEAHKYIVSDGYKLYYKPKKVKRQKKVLKFIKDIVEVRDILNG